MNTETEEAMTKRCSTCEEEKLAEEFYTGRNSCKDCVRMQVQAYKQANAEKIREDKWRRQGIAAMCSDRYAKMAADQGFCCAICSVAPAMTKSLAVDHNHETGVVRGLLDYRCNITLGWVEQNWEPLIDYLAKHEPSLLEYVAQYLDEER